MTHPQVRIAACAGELQPEVDHSLVRPALTERVGRRRGIALTGCRAAPSSLACACALCVAETVRGNAADGFCKLLAALVLEARRPHHRFALETVQTMKPSPPSDITRLRSALASASFSPS